jgi:hypothetical protein
MENLEALLLTLLLMTVSVFLVLWCFWAIVSISRYFEAKKRADLSFYSELSGWEVFKLIFKTLSYGPFTQKIILKYQKENENDN